MRSISFKDMLSDGRFLWMIEPNCIPMLLRLYFQSLNRVSHVLVMTGIAFYKITEYTTSLCSTPQSILHIVQAIEGLGLAERASGSSFPGNSSDFIAHSLNEWNASCLPFFLVGLFIFRGLPGHRSFLQLVSHCFLTELLRIAISLPFTHDAYVYMYVPVFPLL